MRNIEKLRFPIWSDKINQKPKQSLISWLLSDKKGISIKNFSDNFWGRELQAGEFYSIRVQIFSEFIRKLINPQNHRNSFKHHYAQKSREKCFSDKIILFLSHKISSKTDINKLPLYITTKRPLWGQKNIFTEAKLFPFCIQKKTHIFTTTC